MLHPEEGVPVPIKREFDWTAVSAWTLYRRYLLLLTGIESQFLRCSSRSNNNYASPNYTKFVYYYVFTEIIGEFGLGWNSWWDLVNTAMNPSIPVI